jgi:uncharacterized membrane protein YccC
MLLRDKQAWMFSAKSFLAAALALWIGLRFDLPRPYWAMTTAYVVMQPVLGGTRSRGIYRICGTLIAAVAVVAIVPVLIQVPSMLSLALSLWLSLCLFVALLHRGPSSYVFLLAGYTAAFIGFPSATQPDAIFSTAIARSEEIIVGSLCAVIVGAVVFPASIKPVIRRRVDALLRDAASWCIQVLDRKGSPAALRRHMAADLAQLDLIIPFAGRDDPRHGEMDERLRDLRAHMLGLLPVLSSIEDRLDDLESDTRDQGSDTRQDGDLHRLIDDLRAWIGQDALPREDALRDFRSRIASLRPVLQETFDSSDLLRDSLLLRLRELAELWYDSRHLQSAVLDGTTMPPLAFPIDLRRLVRIGNRHIDWSMLVFSSLAPGATLFAYCLLWIAVGWSNGAAGAMMAAVAAAFFAAQDDPAPNILAFLLWASLSIIAAGVYLFGVMPAIHDFVPLIIATAPYFLLIGLITTRPRLFLPGMILLTNFASLLSVQNGYVADFSLYVNSALSTVIGLMFAAIMTRLFRSVGAEWSARRLIRQGWQLIAAAARGRGQNDRNRFMVRMLDLLSLLAPRLASLPAESDIVAVDMLDEVRIGLNIINLRRARSHLPARNQGNLNQLLEQVSTYYDAQGRAGRPLTPPPALREALEASLSRLHEVAPSNERDEALLGLVGLRIGLFPRQQLSGSASAS